VAKEKKKGKEREGAMLVGHHRPDLLRDETRKEEGRLVGFLPSPFLVSSSGEGV
jgi:hypothetical protein